MKKGISKTMMWNRSQKCNLVHRATYLYVYLLWLRCCCKMHIFLIQSIHNHCWEVSADTKTDCRRIHLVWTLYLLLKQTWFSDSFLCEISRYATLKLLQLFLLLFFFCCILSFSGLAEIMQRYNPKLFKKNGSFDCF